MRNIVIHATHYRNCHIVIRNIGDNYFEYVAAILKNDGADVYSYGHNFMLPFGRKTRAFLGLTPLRTVPELQSIAEELLVYAKTTIDTVLDVK